jgi:hypothetical protein
MKQKPDHTVKMHELPDEYLADALPIAKRIALAQGLVNYNILQVCPPLPSYLFSLRHLPAARDAEQRTPSPPRSRPRPFPRHSKTQRDRGTRLWSRKLALTETLHGRPESIPCRVSRKAGGCG